MHAKGVFSKAGRTDVNHANGQPLKNPTTLARERYPPLIKGGIGGILQRFGL